MAKSANPLFRSFLQAHKPCETQCRVTRCDEPGCSLILPTDKAIGVKCELCDAFAASDKKPELVVLYSSGQISAWFVIEMKSRPQHTKDIVAQLQAGADAIRNHPCFRFDAAPQTLKFILLYSEGWHQDDFRALRQNRLSFGGDTKISILIKHCRTSFDELILSARLS